MQTLPGARTTPRLDTKAVCPLCGTTSIHTQYALGQVGIRRCGQCGFVFAHGESGDGSDEGYYESMGGYERFLAAKKPQWRALFRDLARRTKGRRLLDVGCARGYALALGREFGWLPYGVETSGDDVAFARSQFGLNVHHGTLETCPFKEGSFDAIIMWSVIEHMHDPRSALQACHRLLKPSGVLSIHTCNADSAVTREAGAGWSMYQMPGHVSFFSPATMYDVLETTGFEVVDLKTGLRSRPVKIDPEARARPSLRRFLARAASGLGLKEPLRRAIYGLRPEFRDQGEFMAALARRK